MVRTIFLIPELALPTLSDETRRKIEFARLVRTAAKSLTTFPIS
jgi:hypothetical protein